MRRTDGRIRSGSRTGLPRSLGVFGGDGPLEPQVLNLRTSHYPRSGFWEQVSRLSPFARTLRAHRRISLPDHALVGLHGRAKGRGIHLLDGSEFLHAHVIRANGALLEPIEGRRRRPLRRECPRCFFAPLAASYAVSPDGERFIAPAAPPQARVEPWTLVLNWPAALKN
jgi:hypothetical protein